MRIYTRKECLEVAVKAFGFFAGLVDRRPTPKHVETLEHCAGAGHDGKSVCELAQAVVKDGHPN